MDTTTHAPDPDPDRDRATAGEPAVATLRSNWQELGVMLPDLGRLLRALAGDHRVPARAKLVAAAAAGYALLGHGSRRPALAGGGFGLDHAVVLAVAVRHLIAAAGYDVVRERWTGSDGGFALLIVLAGVDR